MIYYDIVYHIMLHCVTLCYDVPLVVILNHIRFNDMLYRIMLDYNLTYYNSICHYLPTHITLYVAWSWYSCFKLLILYTVAVYQVLSCYDITYCIIVWCIMLQGMSPYHVIPYYTRSCFIIVYCWYDVLCYAIVCFSLWHRVVLYYLML